jgi:hypothetical protein
VPENVLWAPSRIVWNGFTQAELESSATISVNTTVDTITDKLFLPTEWEMYGYRTESHTTETEANQGHFAYYANKGRIKYNSSSSAVAYRLASPHSASATNFCTVISNDFAGRGPASYASGFAPAFCVK